jgi:DNA mismatch repair protein MutL
MINKIAAGEVIERPASVVKELVENSIDAGATRIDIVLENGGSNLIRIVDNGCGIAAEQLSLALSPHATSKLTDADDLFRILSFGFRGEALASVAEISQLTLKSRTAENNTGAQIQSNGGERSEPASCGMPVGTQIEVRNLFFNTPVRRRYMKSTTTEFGHVTEAFTRLVLPQPQIHFTLKHNERIVHELPPTDDPLARIRQLFGEAIVSEMLAVESPAKAAVRVSGYVSHPNQHRPNNRMQYFFLNRRYIRDRALQHALNEAYRGILVSGRFPLAFLQIELPPDMFDVNVHPTKMEVRFLDSNRIYTGFLTAIREKFLTSDLRSRVQTADGRRQTAADVSADSPPWETETTQNALDPATADKKRQQVQDWIAQIPVSEERRQTADGRKQQSSGYTSLSIHHLPSRQTADGRQQTAVKTADSRRQTATDSEGISSPLASATNCRLPSAVYSAPDERPVVQMLDRYLVMEMEEGIALIDQHALHERILYEQLKERMSTGQLESQRLLVPIPVDLSPNEFSCVLENSEFFQTLGMQVEPFGGNTMLISAFPAVLSKTPPLEILLSIVEPFLEMGKKLNKDELLNELLHSMACKAAVKAGDRLSAQSIQHLIQLAEMEINAHHCPHGRPSMLVLTREEIDKMFERT